MTDSINIKEALRYMGCGSKEPPQDILKIVKDTEKELLKCASPKYLYRIFDIAENDDAIIAKNTTLRLEGKDIKKHLNGCNRIILMCATLSVGVDRLIKTLQVEDMVKALAADALATALTEQVCDEAENEAQKTLENCHFTWRFSPGYGDLPLSIQGNILNILDAQRKIGLCTTENSLLIPTKSVTAVIGVSENEVKKKSRSCGVCNLRNVCRFRKEGEHCA